jgi:hypothetical protein
VEGSVEPADWFDVLAAALPVEGPDVSDEERAALLDLARIAAHTSERWTAPISTYVVGVALASLPADRRSDVLRELVATLEA